MAVIGSPEQVTRELPQKLGMLERQKIDPLEKGEIFIMWIFVSKE
jgi:hypothetical protein